MLYRNTRVNTIKCTTNPGKVGHPFLSDIGITLPTIFSTAINVYLLNKTITYSVQCKPPLILITRHILLLDKKKDEATNNK